MKNPEVSIIMGSTSDCEIMQAAYEVLQEFGVLAEVRIISAHRTPEHMVTYAQEAHQRGIKVIIAGAGGAAHLPGMVASLTHLPVIGVPVNSKHSLAGLDSLLSIVQMPGGIPVATVAIDGARNAGLLALRILALNNTELRNQLISARDKIKNSVLKQDQDFSAGGLGNGI